MGRQVRFMLSDEDNLALEKHLHDVGAVFIPLRSSSPDLDPRPSLATPLEPWGWGADVVRHSDLPDARRTFQPTPFADPPADGYWRFDHDSAPAMDYTRSGVAPPREGRLHFDTIRFASGAIVPADPEFVAWADGILRWVRRTFRYEASAQRYVGPPKAGNNRTPSSG